MAHAITGVHVARRCRTAGQTPARLDKPWFNARIVGMEVGPTGAQFGYSEKNETLYASRFNGQDIVQKCVEANVEYLVIWARDGDWAYYDSKIAASVRDWANATCCGKPMEEAAKHQLPIIAYCVVQQAGNFLADHPEFQAIDAAGKADRPLLL